MFEGKPSKVEGYKTESRHLRGTIIEGLKAPEPIFDEADHQLLKFHGVYQGYDRDTATELKQQGLDKRHEFMIRVKAPGGMMTAAQYLALDEIARNYAGGRLRITTRQAIQLHAVAKKDLWATIHGINEALLSSFCACGDVVRNVTCTAAPFEDARHQRLRADTHMLAREMEPRTGAYHEIWVEGVDVAALPDGEPAVDPMYGPTYLPRKFKIGIAPADENDIDVLTNDLAILPLYDGETLVGYNLAVGGGLGMTHNKAHTYPRLATLVAFVPPGDLLEITRRIIELQRDHGDRNDRRHARLKYVVDAKGIDWIKADLDRRAGRTLEAPRPMRGWAVKDHLGWHEQGDGRWFIGLTVKSGRIEDAGSVRLATAFRRIATEVPVRPVLSPSQDIYFADIEADDRAKLEAILAEEGVELPGRQTPIRRWALACPALPTCGLALNEAERVLDDIVGDFETMLERNGLAGERISLRITGCPNGCARPYTGDIGLVGRTPDTYAIFLGGDFEGTYLNERVFERVNIKKLATTLEPIVVRWKEQRAGQEGFGAFCRRFGLDQLAELAATAQAAE